MNTIRITILLICLFSLAQGDEQNEYKPLKAIYKKEFYFDPTPQNYSIIHINETATWKDIKKEFFDTFANGNNIILKSESISLDVSTNNMDFAIIYKNDPPTKKEVYSLLRCIQKSTLYGYKLDFLLVSINNNNIEEAKKATIKHLSESKCDWYVLIPAMSDDLRIAHLAEFITYLKKNELRTKKMQGILLSSSTL